MDSFDRLDLAMKKLAVITAKCHNTPQNRNKQACLNYFTLIECMDKHHKGNRMTAKEKALVKKIHEYAGVKYTKRELIKC